MKKGKDEKAFERRHALRAEKAMRFRYPFGLLTILELFADVRPAKKAKGRGVAA